MPQVISSTLTHEDVTVYRHAYMGNWYSVGFTNEHGEARVTPLLTEEEAREFMRVRGGGV